MLPISALELTVASLPVQLCQSKLVPMKEPLLFSIIPWRYVDQNQQAQLLHLQPVQCQLPRALDN